MRREIVVLLMSLQKNLKTILGMLRSEVHLLRLRIQRGILEGAII